MKYEQIVNKCLKWGQMWRKCEKDNEIIKRKRGGTSWV